MHIRAWKLKEQTIHSQLHYRVKENLESAKKKNIFANYSGNGIVTLPKALCKLGEKFTWISVIEYFSLHRLQVAYFIQFHFHINGVQCPCILHTFHISLMPCQSMTFIRNNNNINVVIHFDFISRFQVPSSRIGKKRVKKIIY